jgi:flagellar basal-body rod modification protein FlgD
MFLDPASSSAPAGAAVGTGTSRAAREQQQLDQNMNRFLTLLITQLQHQDPLQPMDANEFTQQLVQFASVEQQIYQNASLEKLLGMQRTAQASGLVSYIGNTVELDGGELALQDGTAVARYALAEPSVATRLTITDAAGRVVATLPGATRAGAATLVWDGTGADGRPLPDGPYRLSVAATAASGKSIDVATRVLATVTGVANDGAEPELLIGDRRVPLADVVSVGQRPLPSPDQTSKA